MISYEFPLNERVRTLLRLEDLYKRVFYFLADESAHAHHACLLGIFEIMEVASRADLKSDLLQELDRQRHFLNGLKDNPEIAIDKLRQVMSEIDAAFAGLFNTSGKTGQELRENEWLMAIKQRGAIPGGVCEFDLPSYYFWRKRPAEQRRVDIEVWLKPVMPIFNSLKIVLRVLRESGKAANLVAVHGVFQQTPMERTAQLLRLSYDVSFDCVPELQANKYALNIRFLRPESVQRTKVIESNIPFQLAFCNL